MRLEAVIVCKDYADFLEHTLPANVGVFDRLVVVTHPSDKATKTLCNRFGVDCVETEVFHEEGDKFNKARGINLGLSHLRHDDSWLLQLDADVVLPDRFRQKLHQARLDKSCIYGADRLNVIGADHWMANKDNVFPQHQHRYLVHANSAFPIGARLLHQEYGYCPIGYFQLWHSSQGKNYPIASGSAEHSDVVFAVQWPRHKRVLLPEIFVFHLESAPAPMGANWKGRTTALFKPGPNCRKRAHRWECGPYAPSEEQDGWKLKKL